METKQHKVHSINMKTTKNNTQVVAKLALAHQPNIFAKLYNLLYTAEQCK